MTRAEHTAAIEALRVLLRHGPLTARGIAAHFRCSVPTANARVQALKARCRVETEIVREGLAGPASVAYRVR